ncbi:MAG: hypothetical protein AAGA80_24415 [Cyanobacteria bacterium P01_F01_bin.143]
MYASNNIEKQAQKLFVSLALTTKETKDFTNFNLLTTALQNFRVNQAQYDKDEKILEFYPITGGNFLKSLALTLEFIELVGDIIYYFIEIFDVFVCDRYY